MICAVRPASRPRWLSVDQGVQRIRRRAAGDLENHQRVGVARQQRRQAVGQQARDLRQPDAHGLDDRCRDDPPVDLGIVWRHKIGRPELHHVGRDAAEEAVCRPPAGPPPASTGGRSASGSAGWRSAAAGRGRAPRPAPAASMASISTLSVGTANSRQAESITGRRVPSGVSANRISGIGRLQWLRGHWPSDCTIVRRLRIPCPRRSCVERCEMVTQTI